MPGKRDRTNYQTLADFARFIGVNRSTVLYWVKTGRLKSTKKDLHSKKRHRLSEELFYNCARKTKKEIPKTLSEIQHYMERNRTVYYAELDWNR